MIRSSRREFGEYQTSGDLEQSTVLSVMAFREKAVGVKSFLLNTVFSSAESSPLSPPFLSSSFV